jgi:hypothetical protein
MCVGGEPVYRLSGRWNKFASLTRIETGEEEVIWEKSPFPENFTW